MRRKDTLTRQSCFIANAKRPERRGMAMLFCILGLLQSAALEASEPVWTVNMFDWQVDYGSYQVEDYGDYQAGALAIEAQPASDGRTSYFIAPSTFHGDWRGYSQLSFTLRDWGGTYYGPDSYGAVGDVVIRSGRISARYDLPAQHDGAWRQVDIPLDSRWILTGTNSLETVLNNVTSLEIRAEYGAGADYADLANVTRTTGKESLQGWTVDYGGYTPGASVIQARPAGDGRTSYYHAPAGFLGDWRGYSELSFRKKSWGGTYYDPGSYGATGDVILRNGAMTARFDLPENHDGSNPLYVLPLKEQGWALSGGATSLEHVLSNVTGVGIRAEYGVGTDYSELSEVSRCHADIVYTAPSNGTDYGAGPRSWCARSRLAASWNTLKMTSGPNAGYTLYWSQTDTGEVQCLSSDGQNCRFDYGEVSAAPIFSLQVLQNADPYVCTEADYLHSDHWCTKLRNLDIDWRVAQLSPEDGMNSMLAWSRNAQTGDIQCFSRDGTNCVTSYPFMEWGAPGDAYYESDWDWLTDEGYLQPVEWSGAYSNNRLLNLTQQDFQDVQPVVCTDDEYRQQGHWCEELLTRINEPWKERLGLKTSSHAPGISYLFSPQGNPACLSLDGEACADLQTEAVEFSRIAFLECGPEAEFVDKIGFDNLQVLSRQKGFFGAGYEDPDHWCARLRNDAVAWRPMEKKIDESITHRYYWSYTAMGEKVQILSLDGFTPYFEKRMMGYTLPYVEGAMGPPVRAAITDEIRPVLSSAVKMAAIPYVCTEFDIADESHPCYNIPGASFQNYRELVQQRIDNNADTIASLLDAHAQEQFGVPADQVDEWLENNQVQDADADFDYAQAAAKAMGKIQSLEESLHMPHCYCYDQNLFGAGVKTENIKGAWCDLRLPEHIVSVDGIDHWAGNGLSGLAAEATYPVEWHPLSSNSQCSEKGTIQIIRRTNLAKQVDIYTNAQRVIDDRKKVQVAEEFLVLRELPAYEIYSSPEFRNMSPTHAYALLARHAWEAPLLQHLKDYYEADSVAAIRATHEAIASHPGLEFIEDEFLSVTHIDDVIAAMDTYYDNQTMGNFFRFLGSMGESALAIADPMGLFSAGPKFGIKAFEALGDTIDGKPTLVNQVKDFLVDLFDGRVTDAEHVEARLLELVGFDSSMVDLVVNLGNDLASAEFEEAIEDASKDVYTEAFPMISEAAALLGMSPADGGSNDDVLRMPYNSLEELKLFGVEDMDATQEELDYFDARKRSALARFEPDAERGEACINLWHTNPTKWENLDNLFAFSMGADYWDIVHQSAVPRDITGDNQIDKDDLIASLCNFLFERVNPGNPNFHVYADSDFHLVGFDVLGGRQAGFMYDDRQGLILLNRAFVERDGFDDWFPQYAEELGHAVNWARCFIFDMKPISTFCEVEGDPGKRFRDAIALPYNGNGDSAPDAFAVMLNGLPDHDKNEHRLVSFQGDQGDFSTAVLEGDWDIDHGRIWEGFGPRDGEGGYSMPVTWGGWLRAGLDFSNSASGGAVSDDFQLEVAFTYPHMRRIGKPTVSATDHRECSNDELDEYDWDTNESKLAGVPIGTKYPDDLYPAGFNGARDWKWLDCEVPTWWWDFGFRGRNRIELAGADGPNAHNDWGFSAETNLITKYTFSVPVQRKEQTGADLNVKVQGRHWRYANKHIALIEPGVALHTLLARMAQQGKYR
ncbi:MAG: hypothetical protein DWQ08_13545, partial [Proteobacteria bacterium]